MESQPACPVGDFPLYTSNLHRVSMQDWYRGRSAFLVLSGPSLNALDLTLLQRRGIVTMAVNNAWACLRPTMWTHVDSPGRFLDVGWKDPSIIKFSPAEYIGHHLNVKAPDGSLQKTRLTVRQMPAVFFYPRVDRFDHARFLDEPGAPWGQQAGQADSLGLTGKRSVMLVAIRILYYLGFRTIYLLGCDFKMTADHRYAFDEQRSPQAVVNNQRVYDVLQERLAAVRPHFEARGLNVINCSPGSGLRAFDRMAFEEAVAEASSDCAGPIATHGWYVPANAVQGGLTA